MLVSASLSVSLFADHFNKQRFGQTYLSATTIIDKFSHNLGIIDFPFFISDPMENEKAKLSFLIYLPTLSSVLFDDL